jgi:hypothetical protein
MTEVTALSRRGGFLTVEPRAVGGTWNDLPPALLDHAMFPSLRKRERFVGAGAPFREKALAVDENAEFPAAQPCHQRAAGAVLPTLHRPEGANVVRSVLT